MNIPSNPADRKKIQASMQEISDSLYRIAAEREFIKEAIADTCDKFELDKKIFRKMVTVFHKANFTEEVAEHEQFEVMYESITSSMPVLQQPAATPPRSILMDADTEGGAHD
jgi:hypothetical protein